ncbi:MAG TPA: CocE/NonD family hydrolase [Xanthomonadales bacterium]|nr:CocE/NonD family hydrolase [Xanthomonadales bacterium]
MARLVLLALCFGAVSVSAQTPPPPVDAAKVAFEWGIEIPLRDGVKLAATKYAPRGQEGALPCVFTLTPYIAQSYHDRGMYFGANGYVFLTVDARGRGNSGGDFTPLLQEAHDAHDVVEWLATQPYCNGRTSMWGGSYAGYNQWAAAKEFPPHLTSIVPVASPYAGVDFPMRANMFYPYDLQWLALTAGRASQSMLFGDSRFWTAAYKRVYLEHRPFASLDTELGLRSPIFQTWISHPTVDAYWDSYNPTDAQYARIDLPILSITGHYDGDQPGAIEHYRRHMQHAGAAARAKHWLVIGPWDHAGTRTPRAEVGGLKFGEASLVDMNQLHREWYDHTLKGGPLPAFLKAPVAYYVTGRDKWRYAASLDAVTAESRAFHLGSEGGRANDVYASGSLLVEPRAQAGVDRYVYDPLDTGNAELPFDPDGPYLTDQTAVVQNRGRSLVYHTPPFPRATEVSGFFRLDAWLELDQPDTDFDVSVFEIRPDGSSVALSQAQMRARHRDGLRQGRPVPAGEVLRYRFDNFSFISRELQRGSRLRLVIGPVDSVFAQKNYNSGGVVAQESESDARTVTVKLHHGPAHPSALYVPLAPPE